MTDLEDTLWNIFTELRQRHIPLGQSDYLTILEAVNGATNIEDEEVIQNIKILCRLLWAKSLEDLDLFDETFAIHMSRYEARNTKKEQHKQHTSETKPPLPPQSQTPKTDQPTPQPKTQPEPHVCTPLMHPLLRVRSFLARIRTHLRATKNDTPREGYNPPTPKTIPPPTHTTNPTAPSLRTSNTMPKITDHQKTTIYHLTPRPPMDKRDMASIWRKLRRLQCEGLSEELDIQATIAAISHTGFLLKPILQYHRRNQAKLVLMIDQGGSMEPFTLLMAALLDSIQRSGSLRHIQRFYFHDTPEDYLYTSPILLGARALDDVLSEHCQNNSVLLIGDAGAARGYYDSSRVQATQNFIDKLSQYTYLYSWLNPMPKNRWAYTTAGYIAQLLPMFQLDWDGLNDTVNVLRGQSYQAAFTDAIFSDAEASSATKKNETSYPLTGA